MTELQSLHFPRPWQCGHGFQLAGHVMDDGFSDRENVGEVSGHVDDVDDDEDM